MSQVNIPSAAATLDAEFLEARALILRVGAILDRINRGSGDLAAEPRLEKLRRAIQVLLESEPKRAEQIQLVFSQPYEADWQTQFEIKPRQS
jgi:hypothetical protein